MIFIIVIPLVSDPKTNGPKSDPRHRGLFLRGFSLFSPRRNKLQKFIFILQVSHLIPTSFDHIIYMKALNKLEAYTSTLGKSFS